MDTPVTPASTTQTDDIGCSDQCGRSVAAADLNSSGWTFLPIQRRYRCPDCWRELTQANAQPGTLAEQG